MLKFILFLFLNNEVYAGLWQFQEHIDCFMPGVTGLDYAGYGCFCGTYNQGRPIDSVDSCCFLHDNCYAKADEDHNKTDPVIGFPNSYTHSYNLVCNKITSKSFCSDNDPYGAALCECDRSAAHCFRRTRSDYNRVNSASEFDKEKCHMWKNTDWQNSRDPAINPLKRLTQSLESCQLSESTDACCGGVSYDSALKLCCDGVLRRKNEASSACCGSEAYSIQRAACCGQTLFHTLNGSCCGKTVYGKLTHKCCALNRTTDVLIFRSQRCP